MAQIIDKILMKKKQTKPVAKVVEEIEEKTTEIDSPIDLKEKVMVRCPNCPWKAGLLDENTYCPNCSGTGQVAADPLE